MTDTALKRLSKRERVFVEAYVDLLSNTEAYLAVDPKVSRESARRKGHEFKKKPHVKAEIDRLFEQRLENSAEERYRVLLETQRLAKANLQDLVDANGNLLPINEWSADAAAAVASVEVATKPDGDEILHIHKIRLWDKNPPRRDLMQYYGMLIDKKEVSGPGGAALEFAAILQSDDDEENDTGIGPARSRRSSAPGET